MLDKLVSGSTGPRSLPQALRLRLATSRRSPLAGRRSEPQSSALARLIPAGLEELGATGVVGCQAFAQLSAQTQPTRNPPPGPSGSPAGGLLSFETSFISPSRPPESPTPGSPPGQALSSSPGRTWLPAPRLPSPIHSLRAGRRQGNCCGPGCSTPPPWGCGRGSCRSLLRRWKRDFRRGSTRSLLLRQDSNPPNHKGPGLRPLVNSPALGLLGTLGLSADSSVFSLGPGEVSIP